MKTTTRLAKKTSHHAGDDLWQWAQKRPAPRPAEPAADPAGAPATQRSPASAVLSGEPFQVPRLTLFLDRCRARIQDSFSPRRPRL
jgi:hypothetical protein